MRSLFDIVLSWFTSADALEMHSERRRMIVHSEVSGGKQ